MNRTIRILGLLLVAMLPAAAASAGGGGHCAGPQTEGATTIVDISQGCFSPTVTRVTPGQTVVFTNSDPYPHNVVGHSVTWGSAEQLSTGQEIEATFDVEGLYPFACTIHPGMVGVVVVEDEADQPTSLIGPTAADERSETTTALATSPGWDRNRLAWAAAGAAFLALGWRRVKSRARADRVEAATG